MEDEKIGCWALGLILLVGLMIVCYGFFFVPREPLFTVRMSRPVPTATPNVFHQVILEQAQTDNEIELLTAKHELRKEWAWVAAPWAIIVLGGYCLITAWRKWLKVSH